ncbi:MAG: hypothetical protein ACRYFX_04970 [Janthinobacterium lividum]
MKPLVQLTSTQLLLLGLLVLLAFGNCNGGVHYFLTDMGRSRRTALRSIIDQNHRLRADARQHLHGRARRDEYERIEQLTNARLDSLLPAGRGKLINRRPKVERQLRRHPD